MSNARDKANIPALNFSSTGIDDNATSTAITITSGSDVQIGSTNSGVGGLIDLSIGNLSSAGGITLWSPTSSAHSIGFGDGFSGTDRYRGYLEYHHTGDSMRFGTSATERMRINSTGVGIGTSSPDEILHIAKSGAGSQIKIQRTNANTTGSAGSIGFANSSGYYTSGIEALGDGDDNGTHLVFRTHSDASSSDDDPFDVTERMRITSAGNVGIGTSSPSYELDVAGKMRLSTSSDYVLRVGSTDSYAGILLYDGNTSAVTNNQIVAIGNELRFKTSDTYRLNIDSSGNVGIGTSSPRAKLDLGAGSGDSSTISTTLSDYQLILEAPQGSGDYGRNIGWSVGTNGLTASINAVDTGTSDKTSLAFITGDTSGVAEAVRITHDGKVAINTTSPTGKFEVHSGGGGSNYSGSSAIKSGVTWGSESSSHTISIFDYNENDNSSGMLLVHAKADNNKCGTLMLLFTKKGGSGVDITTVSTKSDGMSTFSASTSGNNINISTDSDCAICWQSYYAV